MTEAGCVKLETCAGLEITCEQSLDSAGLEQLQQRLHTGQDLNLSVELGCALLKLLHIEHMKRIQACIDQPIINIVIAQQLTGDLCVGFTSKRHAF